MCIGFGEPRDCVEGLSLHQRLGSAKLSFSSLSGMSGIPYYLWSISECLVLQTSVSGDAAGLEWDTRPGKQIAVAMVLCHLLLSVQTITSEI